MEIKPNNNVEPVTRAWAAPTRASAARAGTDSAAFEHAQALEQALQTAPAVRPEMVARARQLISDVKYPPDETIRQIATLLALSLEPPADGPSSKST